MTVGAEFEKRASRHLRNPNKPRARRQNQKPEGPARPASAGRRLSPWLYKQTCIALTAPAHELAVVNGIVIGVIEHGRLKPHRPAWATRRGPTGRVDRDYFETAEERLAEEIADLVGEIAASVEPRKSPPPTPAL